jgi:hypothetical protein
LAAVAQSDRLVDVSTSSLCVNSNQC